MKTEKEIKERIDLYRKQSLSLHHDKLFGIAQSRQDWVEALKWVLE